MNKIYVYEAKKIEKTIDDFLSKYKSDFKQGQLVVIKPNWVNSRPDYTGATTNNEILESVIKFFKKKKLRVVIAEGSGYEFDTEKTFKVLGVDYFEKKYGVKIINTRKCETIGVAISGKILKKTRFPREVIESDWIINIPKIKTHVLTGVTLCMKNLFGLLPDDQRRFAHVFGLHQSIVDLAKFFDKKTINILDGLVAMSGEGPVFGDTFNLNLIIAGRGMADIDRFCCKLLNLDYKKIEHIYLAKKLFSDNVEVSSDYKKQIPVFDLPTASKLYKFRYWGVFAFDWIISPFTKKSYIPNIVTRFGVRLSIDNEKCNKCNKCVKFCPVGAIQEDKLSNSLKIDFEKCRYLRCFKCFDVCDKNAIKIKGFSRPRNR